MDNGESSYRRYLKGDEEAFQEIVKLYFDGLVLFVYGYVKNLETAEDIAIDVFAQFSLRSLVFLLKSISVRAEGTP